MQLEIMNFRSISHCRLDLSPITVFYGPNAAGKSSALYALLTLRNILLNPNQTPDAFFNYLFANLGGFEAAIFDHRTHQRIRLAIELPRDKFVVRYAVEIASGEGTFELRVSMPDSEPITLRLETVFPYPLNKETRVHFDWHGAKYTAAWNGVTATISSEDSGTSGEATALAAHFNACAEYLRRLGIVPVRRGFSKPTYSTQPLTPALIGEDELATLLATAKYLDGRVSHYMEEVVERDLRVSFKPGTSVFSLLTTDRHTGVSIDVVSDGAGVGQVLYVLARSLHVDTDCVCIEEPELNLHPSAIRALARAFARMAKEEDKQFIVTTHSEAFVAGLLQCVRNGLLRPEELACYLTLKERKETLHVRQEVNDEGQIEGGLSSFVQAQLADLYERLGVGEE